MNLRYRKEKEGKKLGRLEAQPPGKTPQKTDIRARINNYQSESGDYTRRQKTYHAWWTTGGGKHEV